MMVITFGTHDDVIKWKHFPRYWPFVRGIHRWPVNSPHKGQWRGALMFSSIPSWIKGGVNNSEAGDLRRHPVHNDVILMNIANLTPNFVTQRPFLSMTSKMRANTGKCNICNAVYWANCFPNRKCISHGTHLRCYTGAQGTSRCQL